MHRRIAALALAAVALLGLTACTATASPTTTSGASQPGAADQSITEACELIRSTIADATSEFENAASADPAAVVEAMKTAAAKISDASAQVSNAEVAALLPDLREMFEQTSDVMQALVDGDVSKLGDMAELGQSFQDTSERFQSLCAS